MNLKSIRRNDEWNNPDKVLMVIRCTNREYGKSFIEKGQLKFSTPQSWVDYAEECTTGRGDFYEGTKAFAYKDYDQDIEKIRKIYPESVRTCHDDRVLFKDKSAMQLPCFCLYALKQSMFSVPYKTGWQTITTTIPGSYFRDFADHMTQDEVALLPEEKRPAVVVLKDFDAFFEQLKKHLTSIGVKENEILLSKISYLDYDEYGKDGWMDFNMNSPKELFVKPIRFQDQNELRIIVNSSNPEVRATLDKPIEIGSLSEIAGYCEVYFEKGVDVEMRAYIDKE